MFGCLEGCWKWGIDPIVDGAVLPDELAFDVSAWRQEGSVDGGLGSFLGTQWPLVTGHVSVNVTWMDVVEHQVLQNEIGAKRTGYASITFCNTLSSA